MLSVRCVDLCLEAELELSVRLLSLRMGSCLSGSRAPACSWGDGSITITEGLLSRVVLEAVDLEGLSAVGAEGAVGLPV